MSNSSYTVGDESSAIALANLEGWRDCYRPSGSTRSIMSEHAIEQENTCTDADGSARFRERLLLCIQDAGSLSAFARKVATAPNSIRRYLTNSEPTRPMLLKLAQAAGVRLE